MNNNDIDGGENSIFSITSRLIMKSKFSECSSILRVRAVSDFILENDPSRVRWSIHSF